MCDSDRQRIDQLAASMADVGETVRDTWDVAEALRLWVIRELPGLALPAQTVFQDELTKIEACQELLEQAHRAIAPRLE